MRNKYIQGAILFLIFSVIIGTQFGCSTTEKPKEMTKEEIVARGEYLVNFGGCNDCHSPKIMTAMGPVPDTTRLLSGHPENEPMPEIDWKLVTEKHLNIFSPDLTAARGMWGTSYSANLTPDPETGIGRWQPEMFINAIRTGKHLGAGRPIMPPMPVASVNALSDEDLKAIFAYLQTLKPVSNKVPDPTPPVM